LKLLAPTNPKELADRERWFKTTEAKQLAREKGVEFGIEMKGPLENIRQKPAIYWGLHLPEMLATEWYYNVERRQDFWRQIKRVAKFRPDYAVLHGIHLLWHPPAKEYIHRYVDTSSSGEYFKILKANIKLINELKAYFTLKIENFPLQFYYMADKEFLPYTYLATGIGRLDDLLYLKEKTGVGIMFDIEHMQILLNFLNRQGNYHDLPLKRIEELTDDEKELKTIFGFYLKKGYIPYLDPKVPLEDTLKKLKAKFYHLTGSTQDVISGKEITTHKPIKESDKTFRKNLRMVLAQKPEVLVLETASSGYGVSAWNHLRPNETEISFGNLCQILLEEL